MDQAKKQAKRILQAGCNGNVPPVEHRWRKGQSGNPVGRPKGSKELRLIKKLTRERVEAIIVRMLMMPAVDFEEFIKRPDLTTLEVTVANLVFKAKDGQADAFSLLLNRTIGRPSVPKPDQSLSRELEHMTVERLEEIAREILETSPLSVRRKG